MSKYAPLRVWLLKQGRGLVPVTFQEIEAIIGFPLPASRNNRAWWSNNPSNNVMTREWLAAGYETEQVDIAGERLVFRRVMGEGVKPAPASAHFAERAQQEFEQGADAMAAEEAALARGTRILQELMGRVGGLVTLAPDFDPAQAWGEDEWMDPVWPVESEVEKGR